MIGRTKAIVLPEPVWARRKVSQVELRRCGMARFWISVGVVILRDLERWLLIASLIPSWIKSVAGINAGAEMSFTGSISGDLGDFESACRGGGGDGEVGFFAGMVETSGFPVKREDEPKLRVPSGAEFEDEATRFRFIGLEGLEVGVLLSSPATLFSTEALGVVSSPPCLDGVKTLLWAGDPLVARVAFILSHFLFSARSFHFPLYLFDDEAATGGGPPVSMLRRRPSSIGKRRKKDRQRNFPFELKYVLYVL
jgi:hypothetical protein